MIPRRLGDLVAAASSLGGLDGARVVGDPGSTVVEVTNDTDAVGAGWVYCCIVGARHDGHDLAGRAVARGARALLVERELDVPVAQVIVRDARRAMGAVAAEVHGRPSERMTVVGVTGTNGKTTTTGMVAAILEADGRTTGTIGTLTGARTTPESCDLQRSLAAMRDAGCTAVAMEVSSHALAVGRVAGMRFAASVFTNLGRDHLDFHGTEDAYFAAKASLFARGLSGHGVVNADDPRGREILATAAIPCTAVHRSDAADVRVGLQSHSYTWRGRRIDVGIGGGYNVMNSLCAATAASVVGADEGAVAAGLAGFGGVRGRYEVVETQGPTAIVDYAHDAEALERLLESVRDAMGGSGSLVVVFGCGGDRDRTKRPAMGAVAARLADAVVVTSDNPRSEDPAAIARDILSGVVAGSQADVSVELDRREAIRAALAASVIGDVVVVAGKGHEAVQDGGGLVVPFDDASVVRELAGGDA
jgi:UDP-N-acetylmuramoyl-L-alanyl-D-glutamate--2,6-diaminopimelate ligase